MFRKTTGQKYNSKRVTEDGFTFDSEAEVQYYRLLKSNPNVAHFEVHPTYVLQEKFETLDGEKIVAVKYIADFMVQYHDSHWDYVIDIKGMPTETALLKRKIFMYKYPTKKLRWLVRYKGDFVDYKENEQRKSSNRKAKKEAEKNL